MSSPSSYWQQLPHRIYDSVRPRILRANYYLGRYKSAIWLLGDGRSGTTFVADLINYNRRYREMFEPFHPEFVKVMQGMQMHQYIRPDSSDPEFKKLASEIFSGYMVDPFTDPSSTRLIYRNLIIKDIFANLLCCWAVRQLTQYKIRPVLLIRNPFAVALSKFNKKDWAWMTDPREFLKQKQLVNDYLQPYVDVIESVSDDYIERQIMIWSIIHYIPLKQFKTGEVYILFYENLLANPVEEIKSLMKYTGNPVSDYVIEIILSKMQIPSRVAGESSTILQGDSPVESWKKNIGDRQFQQGMQTLKTFGLDHIYGGTSTPRVDSRSLLRDQ